ncbi:MAG: hypothetical protein F4138_00480 [Acidimicrobiia bacterium]|nr:hypothetical protein [Acidimicrobiia bacterium]MYC58288.1 hypothetical protein [Acidimicrobiia bacterium]MYG93463.1 hypothetical protein [Acidimicrobiia bacterium]MYI30005.1 hypothetical protein [Acidimicrobiia bacterium]
MAKTETIRARVEPELKQQADKALADIGVTATEAITRLYEEVVERGELPFGNADAPESTTSQTVKAINEEPPPKEEPPQVVADEGVASHPIINEEPPPPEQAESAGIPDAPESTTSQTVVSPAVVDEVSTPQVSQPRDASGNEAALDEPSLSEERGEAVMDDGSAESKVSLPTILLVSGLMVLSALLALVIYHLVAGHSHGHDEYAELVHSHDGYPEHSHGYGGHADHFHEHDGYVRYGDLIGAYGQLRAVQDMLWGGCDGLGFSSQPNFAGPLPYGVMPPGYRQTWPKQQRCLYPDDHPCNYGEQYSHEASPDCVSWGKSYEAPFGWSDTPRLP